MNENPNGIPNPLNPTPGQKPDVGQVASRAQRPIVASQPSTNQTVANITPTNAPLAAEQLDTGTMNNGQTEPVPTKKNKVGLIVGIIIGAVVLIGAIVAAVILLPNLMGGSDPVVKAMQKIMSGNAPSNVAIDGDINILLNEEGSPIKRVNINLDSDIMVGSMINTSSAVLTFTTYNDKDYSVKFNEVYAADGNIYFKIDGATAALEDSKLLELLTPTSTPTVKDCDSAVTDCVDATNCDSAECLTDETTNANKEESDSSEFLDIIESVDGVWLRLTAENLTSLENSYVPQESPISCMANMVTDLNKNSNTAADLYNKYPFITSTTDKVIIPSKQSPVHLLVINSDNLAGFINSMNNSNLAEEIYSCLGYEDNVSIDEEELGVLISDLPKIYTEVNGNYDFSRLYLESDIDDGTATIIIDLGFEYPTNVNVTEPVDYTDFSKLIQQIMSGLYELPDTVPTNEKTETE